MDEPQKSKIQVTVREVGGSFHMTIPMFAAKLLGVKDKSVLELDLRERTYGNKIELWNHEAELQEYLRKKNRNQNKQ